MQVSWCIRGIWRLLLWLVLCCWWNFIFHLANSKVFRFSWATFSTFSLLLYTRAKTSFCSIWSICCWDFVSISINYQNMPPTPLSWSLFLSCVSDITQASILLLIMCSCSTCSLLLMDCMLIVLTLMFSDAGESLCLFCLWWICVMLQWSIPSWFVGFTLFFPPHFPLLLSLSHQIVQHVWWSGCLYLISWWIVTFMHFRLYDVYVKGVSPLWAECFGFGWLTMSSCCCWWISFCIRFEKHILLHSTIMLSIHNCIIVA